MVGYIPSFVVVFLAAVAFWVSTASYSEFFAGFHSPLAKFIQEHQLWFFGVALACGMFDFCEDLFHLSYLRRYPDEVTGARVATSSVCTGAKLILFGVCAVVLLAAALTLVWSLVPILLANCGIQCSWCAISNDRVVSPTASQAPMVLHLIATAAMMVGVVAAFRPFWPAKRVS
jgi:hypothetical protein